MNVDSRGMAVSVLQKAKIASLAEETAEVLGQKVFKVIIQPDFRNPHNPLCLLIKFVWEKEDK